METDSAEPSPIVPHHRWWHFDPRLSLPARAALVVGGSAVLFTLALSWSAGALLRGQLERHLGGELETLAYQLSDKLDRSIYERSREVQFATSLAPFRTLGAPAAERRRLLEAVLDASPDFAWLGFADPDGKISCGTQGFLENTDAAARAWFVVGREAPYASDVRELPDLARLVARTSSEPPRFLALATPASDPDGKFLGVLAAELRWSWARDVLASVLTEAARRERVSVSLYAANGECLLDSGTSGWTEPPPAPTLGDRRQFRGSMWETVAGDSAYLTGFARSRGFREYRGLGATIAVRRPALDVFAPVDALRRGTLLWGLVFSAAFAAASWIFAARITRRLAAVGAAAHRIRLGDVLSLMPRAPGEHELARMCAELDALVTDFREKQPKVAPKDTHPGIFTEHLVKDRDASKLV